MVENAKILIIGLGEIGYSNAEYMTKLGLPVQGYDINRMAVRRAVRNGVINRGASNFSGFDYYVVCVSTHSIEDMAEPSFGGLFSVAERLSIEGTEGALISIESTVAKGISNKVKEIVGHRLHVAHFPHRYYVKDRDEHGVRQMRVLGGCEECCLTAAISFYRDLLEIPFHLVTSVEVAELTKIIENSYRFLEIAFSEELFLFCNAYGIDYNELRGSINSKWNMNLLEAMGGIGGHCLPKDTEMYRKILSRVSQLSIIESAKEADERYKLELAYKPKLKKLTTLKRPRIERTEAVQELIA
ncbi:MAG: potassium transporter TrkA [Candidatus Bathyarchaeota archaeon]